MIEMFMKECIWGGGFLGKVFGAGMLIKRKGFLVRICELINYKILCYD